jgi:hypothetical protein
MEEDFIKEISDEEAVEVVAERYTTMQALAVPVSCGYHEAMKREYCPTTHVLLNSKVE